MNASSVRLFQTAPHACGYWPERSARDLLLDPTDPQMPLLYPEFLALGFRRSGDHVYRPRCPDCAACVPLRVPVAAFKPDRSQRRCWARNADLRVEMRAAQLDEQRFKLYQRYIGARHSGGGMEGGSRASVESFLCSRWGATRFLEVYQGDRLLAIATTDLTTMALSAVYTFFEPSESQRGLGTYAVLAQLDWARQHELSWMYLGFWIKGHPKMDYKQRFRPAETLVGGEWRPLPAHRASVVGL